MPKFTFTLPKTIAKEGIQQVGGKYNFENGQLTVDEDTARRIKKVLTTYYGCKITQEKDETEDEAEKLPGDDASLTKAATKAK